MSTLAILIGNIGSGKSTVTKKLVDTGYFVVSRDSIRYSIKAGKYLFDREVEPTIFSIEWSMFEKFLEHDFDIVLDEVNVSKRDRKKYIQLAKEYGYKITALILPRISKEESIKRRMSDNHGNTSAETWDEVWTKFDQKYQVPEYDEGFDLILNAEGA